MAEQAFLAPGEAVDLDNCAREPIHIPGLVQPRGVLLALRTDDTVVTQCSANLADVLGVTVDDALGATLDAVVGADAARTVLDHVAAGGDPRLRNPLEIEIPVHGEPARFEAMLHHAPGDSADRPPVLVVELEPFSGHASLTYTSTYEPVRDALGELDRATSMTELYDVAVRRVRELTGFDRVMLYHFDADYNGEVVAEAKRADLNAFLGLHYPASDIPPQARALYEKNWIRLISDIGYTPVPIVPTDDPVTGQPLDLTYGTLRSVSPIHVEYLQNMGVGASMSISLLRDGRLWGLIACHHYSGAHAPSYAARTAAEFLGSVLSVRLVTQAEDDRASAARRSAGVLASLVAGTRDDDVPLVTALTGEPGLLDLVPADGVFVGAEGRTAHQGTTPDDETCLRLARAVAALGVEVLATDRLAADHPALAEIVPGVAGLLAARVPGGASVLWLRAEVLQTVDWGGDPHNKAIARREGDTVRLSPRKSFDRWREVVRGTSEPWIQEQVDVATSLRSYLGEGLLLRGRRDIRAATVLQRSLLPTSLPQVDGWTVEARYEPSGGGLAGGDWYDALALDDGRVVVSVGDVSGHGLGAAATMGQLRNALRALLLAGGDIVEAVGRVDHLLRTTLPGQAATLVLAAVEPGSADVTYVTAGHPPPVVVGPDGARVADVLGEPPLGVGRRGGRSGTVHVAPGGAVVLFSDGLVERRDESIVDSLDRLRVAAARSVDPATLVAQVRAPSSADDATVVVVRRDPPP
ncbi:PAS domain-containing protein [Isoptericola jiangsuensis]|uniref:PAS domain-containing protein n=1 Tax=Isoptericola jiangsuensis TaxID=548579 RepID=A0A2A9ETI4_9MICO|nr:SpoIIE family protein phosphatase [Isoptericola jiangsuensis]PFG41545.1 PAS domain-containing protein [Isoptericola jiangsuensis]